ncbi:MAG: 2,3,4,5-tetrahydropyridine-2,6-dicarboxylate N-succinyltransferase [Acidobacteriota bacterium]|nr:MAG: 2,3,4,5-tetrahydropyridine-2,6-dicarboxylate N-succinyltransferase [Acidobacteriota bacterium]
MDIAQLKVELEALCSADSAESSADFERLFPLFIDGLNRGVIRAAEPDGSDWKVNSWVKRTILLGFRRGQLKDYSIDSGFRYFDKSTYPLRPGSLEGSVRIVPGGTSIRTGSYVSPGVVIMPPAYINVGAYVGKNAMIDSHALVGSCAQVGERVHVSAAAQIGGVLEPVGALPVIIEDDVLIGGNSGVYEGTVVRRRAVIGAGVILTGSTPVYDLVHERVLRKSSSGPLEIPENAVVVPGSRPVLNNGFGKAQGLHLVCPMIVKYRDERTDSATALEDALR